MFGVIGEVFRETLSGLGDRLAAAAPSIIAMLITLAVGFLIAGAVRFVTRFLLYVLGFDRFSQYMGITAVLQKGGIQKAPSSVVSLTLAWIVVAVFVLLAVAELDVEAAEGLVAQAFRYLPRMIIAAVLFVLGILAGAFVRRSVLLAAVNAGLPSARLLAAGAQTALVIVVVAVVLEYLGVARPIILAAFTILFGGVVLALSLAFGLAGRDLARDLLQGLTQRQPDRQPPDDTFRHL
jgi:hypothetical protein